MDKPVQWMTVDELRAEADRTRPAWEHQHVDVGAFLETGELPDLSADARRHQAVVGELDRRASTEA